jgi:hypothetical protein
MNLAFEAAYMFVYAKKLQIINKRIHSASKDAEHHLQKHNAAKEDKKKSHHRHKHERTKQRLQDLIKRHNELLHKLQHHQLLFSSILQKEHKIK